MAVVSAISLAMASRTSLFFSHSCLFFVGLFGGSGGSAGKEGASLRPRPYFSRAKTHSLSVSVMSIHNLWSASIRRRGIPIQSMAPTVINRFTVEKDMLAAAKKRKSFHAQSEICLPNREEVSRMGCRVFSISFSPTPLIFARPNRTPTPSEETCTSPVRKSGNANGHH